MAKRKREYIKTRFEEAADITPAGISSAGFTGKEWEVTIIGANSPDDLKIIDGQEFVPSKNGRLYSAEALASSTPLLEGVKVYDNHLTDAEFSERGNMRSPAKEWIGTLVKPVWDAANRKLKATLKVVDKALASKLLMAYEAEVLNTIGLSIDTAPQTSEAFIGGQQTPLVTGFKKIFSLDLVAEPAAGGGFNRLLASVENNDADDNDAADETQEEIKETDMDAKELKELLGEALAPISDRLDALETSNTKEAEATEETPAVEEQPEAAEDKPKDKEDKPEPDIDDIVQEATAAVRSEFALESTIMRAKLDDKGEKLVRQAYAGRVFEQADLDKFINTVKESAAQGDVTGHVSEAGTQRGTGVKVGMVEEDKYAVAIQRKIMGQRAFQAIEGNDNADVQGRVSEAHKSWIKNGRPNMDTRRLSAILYDMLGGDPFQDPRAFEAVTQTNMSSIVKNTVNLMLAADLSQREMWWQDIVTEEEVDNIDDATLVRTYGMDSLSSVDAGQAYTELNWEDEEETATFQKRGNYVGVHLEALINDKLNVIRLIPQRLANSWYNTLSDLVSAVFTVNSAAGPVLTDSGALFNATAATTAGGHANLLTTALSYAQYGTVRTAMRAQTDQVLGAGRKLLLNPKFLLVPDALENTGETIRVSALAPSQSGGATSGGEFQTVNQFQNQYNTIVVPTWTDADDWAVVADPVTNPAIYLIYLRGGRVPSLFTSDQETQGAMFTNDELRYKVRMMTWKFSSTYDCAPVADFRGLHKSNV